MEYCHYQAADSAWTRLALVLAQYSADQTEANGQALQAACEAVKKSLFAMAPTLNQAGKVDQARTVLAMIQTINTHSADVLGAQASLKASYNVPAHLNFFGTFLSSMALGEKINAFKAALTTMQGQFTEIWLDFPPA